MVSLEFSVLVISIVLSLMMVSFAGRLFEVTGNINDVAAEAARSASLHRNPASAKSSALEVAEKSLSDICESYEVEAHTENFEPGGFVSVDISCEVSLRGLSLLSIPGNMTVSSKATEVIDRYRAKSAL